MIQIDLNKIDKKTVLIIVLSLLLVFLLFRGCNNPDGIYIANKTLNKEISAHEKKVNEYLAKVDSLEKEKAIAEERINFLENRNQEEKIKVLELSKQNIILKSNIEKYNPDELVYFFSERYNRPRDIFKTNLGIVLKDTLTKKIALDLTDGDFTEKELDITKTVLRNEIGKSVLKDTIINNLENQKKNINFAMNEKTSIIDNQKELIDNQVKIIKKESRNKKLLKVSIPVAIGLGIITGVIIAK